MLSVTNAAAVAMAAPVGPIRGMSSRQSTILIANAPAQAMADRRWCWRAAAPARAHRRRGAPSAASTRAQAALARERDLPVQSRSMTKEPPHAFRRHGEAQQGTINNQLGGSFDA